MALGYTERMRQRRGQAHGLAAEHRALLPGAPRRRAPASRRCSFGAPIGWAEAARAAAVPADARDAQPLHRRPGLRARPASRSKPAIETNSVLTLALSVSAGECLRRAARRAWSMPCAATAELEALPLVAPEVRTPIGFMTQTAVRPSRALDAALALVQSPAWQQEVAAHSGSLGVLPRCHLVPLNRPMCGFNLPKAARGATVGQAAPSRGRTIRTHGRGNELPRHPERRPGDPARAPPTNCASASAARASSRAASPKPKRSRAGARTHRPAARRRLPARPADRAPAPAQRRATAACTTATWWRWPR